MRKYWFFVLWPSEKNEKSSSRQKVGVEEYIREGDQRHIQEDFLCWFLVGVFMGCDKGFKCVSTEKWCFSYITLHPLGVIHDTTEFILLKPRPTRRTFSGWKRTCRSWEVTFLVLPQLASPIFLCFCGYLGSGPDPVEWVLSVPGFEKVSIWRMIHQNDPFFEKRSNQK